MFFKLLLDDLSYWDKRDWLNLPLAAAIAYALLLAAAPQFWAAQMHMQIGVVQAGGTVGKYPRQSLKWYVMHPKKTFKEYWTCQLKYGAAGSPNEPGYCKTAQRVANLEAINNGITPAMYAKDKSLRTETIQNDSIGPIIGKHPKWGFYISDFRRALLGSEPFYGKSIAYITASNARAKKEMNWCRNLSYYGFGYTLHHGKVVAKHLLPHLYAAKRCTAAYKKLN